MNGAMSDTPTSGTGSWVDLSPSPVPLSSEAQLLRMLREAQGETSCRTSCGVSPYLSHNSPKSPPNSPSVELAEDTDLDLTDVFINREVFISDFIWDWSSRPNIEPPKQWKLSSSKSSSSSCILSLKERRKKEDNKFVYTVVISNILSLVIGAGIGIWLFRGDSPERAINVEI